MAILFGRVSNVSRGGGGSAIKAAAYRSCSSLSLYATDKETNITVPLVWNYSNKTGLVYSQIHAPENAPEWVYDRQSLWQRVEDVETRKDARLAGEYTMALPKEFTVEQNIELIKEFVEEAFVSRGIIVDVNFHNDNPNNPHVHFMYALRQLVEKLDGEIDFSDYKSIELYTTSFLEGILKETQKNIQNKHLEQNGFEQKLEWGVAKGQEATFHHGGRLQLMAKNQQIILRNAEKIVADPTIVINKLDFNKAVFTKEHIEKELEKSLQITLKNIPVSDQSALDIYIKNELVGLIDTVLLSPKLTLINACDLKGRMLFAKTEQVELEKRFIKNVSDLAKKFDHSIVIKAEDIAPYASGKEFSTQQKEAIISICGGSDLSVLEGWPGAGKSTVTKEIARHYQNAGYSIIAAAPTNKAAQELEAKLGVQVYTTAALRMKWQYERGASKVSIGLGNEYYKEPLYDLKEGALDRKTLLILDEASMLDVATADYFVSEAAKSGAKILPLGDNNQNQAIGSKGAFARMSEVGNRNILTEVNRHQNTDSQIRNLHIEATSALCNYNVSKAISIYGQLNKINILESEQEKEVAIARRYVSKIMEIAKNESIDIAEAAKQVVISSYTNAEIKNLNSMIRDSLKNAGALAISRQFISGGVHGNSSMVELAEGDRIIFTHNLRDDNGKVVVLNNELATVRKLVTVDTMGVGEFLVDVEGARGVRRTLIQTGEKGKIATFKHGYAITNNAVQGASVPYKLYSVDQYSGYSSTLVGLTRHKIDCEIFAARDTLEKEVFKTKDLDVEKVKDEYKAIAYEWVAGKDEDGKDIQVKADIPLWKLGLHLLANKRNDLSFAIDSSHGSVSIELQQQLQAHREQLEGLRQDLNGHEKALSDFETLANTPLKDIGITDKENVDNQDNINSKSKNTQFELFVAQHFDLKENILFDVTDAMDAPSSFRNNNIGTNGKQLNIDDHLTALKAGVVSSGEVNRLNWSDLAKNDQDLILWSYIDKEDRAKLENHYSNVRGLTEEIQSKADDASGIWEELHESGFKSHSVLDGNYKVVSDYLAARVRVRESFEQEENFNKQLTSAKVQKLLIAAIEDKYSLKLKFINTSSNGIKKSGDDFNSKKSSLDAKSLKDNKEFKVNSIEKDRELYLQSLKGKDFKEKLQNVNLFVHDIMESATEGTVLSDLRNSIIQAKKEASEAKAERSKLAGLIIDNWDGHIDADAAKAQPSFERISAQMNLNRLTLMKHADINQEKHYFKKLFNPTLGKNSDYQEIMHAISKVGGSELTTSDISILLKAHDGLCEHVELVSEYIEELGGEKLSVQHSLNTGKARLKEIGMYQDTELPHFMETIYKQDSKITISELDKLLGKTNNKAQLAAAISENPEMLGNLKAHGLVSRIFGSEEKRAVEVNLHNLGNRIEQYIEGKNDMQTLQQDVVGENLANKLIEIDKEIKILRSSLPNATELNILEEIGGLQDSVLKSGAKQQDIDKFAKGINTLLLADNAQDALFAYQAKHNVFFEKTSIEAGKVTTNIDSNIEKTSSDKLLVAISAINQGNELKQQLNKKTNIATQQKQQNIKPIKPRLTFAQVKAGLNQSVVSEIFHRYGPQINPDDKIEKQGSQLKIGSLYMSVSGNKAGLWNRFSDGSKGDIFSFVEEASGCSKYESLEIIASHAGIVAEHDLTTKHTKTRLVSSATQDLGYGQNPNKRANESWVTLAIVPELAPTFNPKKDLAFLTKQGNMVSLVHAYKNQDNQLLGYAVRIEDIDTNKKQVLPVAYCHNKAEKASRWQLKGFTDAGTKPIYGLEKIKQHPNKPILILEGEKTADAAAKLLPDHNVISWMGGAQAVDKVDWSKLANRIVAVWPDNDKPGMTAANNIANHIDCHNGFNGLATIIDTEKLELPKKWDLADEVPQDSIIDKSNLSSIIDNASYNTAKASKKLELSQAISNKFGNNKNEVLDSIDMLIATNRICKDEYISKEIYHDSLIAIAHLKGIDLTQIKDHKDFVTSISSVQAEYQSLHRNYEQDILRQQGINANSANTSKGKAGLSTKEQLAHDLIRDTSILHQVQLEQNKLTATHTEHIEKTVHSEIEKMQRFTDSDKEHAANNVYKTISSKNWRDKLDVTNLAKTSDISLKFTAKSIDEFLVGVRSSTQMQSAHGYLENIRKYGIDENAILTTFKEGRTAGIDALKEMSNKLTIASGLAAEHSLVIAEAQHWGYKANDTDIAKVLLGLDSREATKYITDIRNNHLESYFERNLKNFSTKRYTFNYEEQKALIIKEQDFLQRAYESANMTGSYHDYGKSFSLMAAGKEISSDPSKLNKFLEHCTTIKENNILSEHQLCTWMAFSPNISMLLKDAATTIERHHLKTIPAELAQMREEAVSIDGAFDSIEKEQNKLANQHGKIEYLAFEKDLLDKCELAHTQRENHSLGDLKYIANRALDTGTKTKEELLADLQRVTDLKEAHTKLDKDIEAHHINSTLDNSAIQKQEAKSPEGVLSIITKEQEFLSGLHGNIKYPEEHKTLLAKCGLAHEQKEDNVLHDLKAVAYQSLASGAKSENELVSDLQRVTDLKEAHTKLDKDIEAHHINSHLNKLAKEKQSATNTKEAINAITKEQQFLKGLHDNIKHPEHHDKQLMNSISTANAIHKGGALDDLNRAAEIIGGTKFTQNNSITDIIKKCNDPVDAHKTLIKEYQDHFLSQVHKCLDTIDSKGHITLDEHKFSCPLKLMEHITDKHTHEYIPHKQLQQLHTNTIEHHKEPAMSRGMDMEL